MPAFLRQATAGQSRTLGPFISSTDFLTPQTDLTIANTDVKLVPNGAASINKNAGGGTHRVNGEYGITFDATDSATVGELSVSVVVATALPVFDKFFVLEEAVYDALFAAAAPGYGVAQTGDSFARIGAAGVGLSNIPDLAGLATLLTRLSVTRTDFLDKLNISGNVASSAETTAIQNNTRVVRVVPEVIERPDSGTTTYRIELLLYDDVGNMEAPDSAPTIALVNQAGTDRSSRLDSPTMALVSTGRYRAVYTADVGDTLEQLVWAFSVVEGGNTRVYGNQSVIVDTTAVDFTAADRTKLNTLHDTRIPGVIQPQTGDAYAEAVLVLAAVATVQADTDNLQARLPAALVSGRIDASVGAMAANTMTASALATDAVTEIQSGLGAGLDAAGVRDAVGLTSANLDTQLGAIDDLLDTEVAAIKAKTDALPSDPADQSLIIAATNAIIAAIAALNNISSAQAQAAGEAALAAHTAATTGQVSAVTSTLTAALSALNNLSTAQVNAEMVDVLQTDVYPEPGQGAPAATASLAVKLGYLFKAWRNRKDGDGATERLYGDDATTVHQKATTSEAAGVVTKTEVTTGP